MFEHLYWFKKINENLNSLNLGGFPIKTSLGFKFDYEYIITEILQQIKKVCIENKINDPDIFTEFGSFTVGESGGALFKTLHQKQQNDREKWNMIDSSFMTNLPDTWSINKRFILLPINKWNCHWKVLLGGLTCDSDDYTILNNIQMQFIFNHSQKNPLFIGFFTGVYQESIGGYGGLTHCLIRNKAHNYRKR